MRKHRRQLPLLFISIISLVTLGCLVYFFPPDKNLIFPQTGIAIPFYLDKYMRIPPLPLFFILVGIFFYSIGTFILKSKVHGILTAGFVVTYLLFRLSHLTHPFFLILLLALFFSLEMFVSSRGNVK